MEDRGLLVDEGLSKHLINSEKWPTAGGTYLESSSNFVMGLL